LSEKFRRFVIFVSIRSSWIHLSTLSEFAGPLHSIDELSKQSVTLSINKAKTTDTSIPHIAATGLQLVEGRLNSDSIFFVA
jgi:hypothetical protein